jgi:hypothetical protein
MKEESPMNEPEYFRAMGRLEAQVQALTTAVGELKTKLDGIDTRLDQLDLMANRWKGGFAVILTLGAIAGFVIDHLFRLFSPR